MPHQIANLSLLRVATCGLAITTSACGVSSVELGGPASLVRIEAEPRGVNCADGGTAIHTGLDVDDDTYLDDSEVLSTQYTCNGRVPLQCDGGVIVTGTVTVDSSTAANQLAGVHCVDGDLFVVGVAGADLAPLADLATVTGDIAVLANPGLTNLAPLSNLLRVGGDFIIQGNQDLTSLTGLARLTRAASLAIVSNNALGSLTGFPIVTDFPGALRIANNQALTSLTGLETLQSVASNISIRSNPALVAVDRFDNLRELVLLDIANNRALAQVALPQLTHASSRLLLNDNPALTSVAFPTLVSIGGFLQITGNAQLATLTAPSLVTSSGLFMSGTNAMTSLAMPELTFLTGPLELRVLAPLTNLALPKLRSISEQLVLERLSGLADLGGLAALTDVGTDVTLVDNAALPTNLAQAFVARLRMGGTATVMGNKP